MKWIEASESSAIARFGYDGASQELMVEFKHGAAYNYFDVPESVFEQMKTAPSKGRFFSDNINGQYHYTRL